MSMTPEEKRARYLEYQRRYRESNREAKAETERRYREANKEAANEKNRRYYENNKEATLERSRRYYEANRKAKAEKDRRCARCKGFVRENGSSFEAWVSSVAIRHKVFEAIANLTPDPGQTLAELIHELSGYAMEVCEQIANPPLIEDTKEPPTIIEDGPTLTPAPAPDLF